MQKVAIIGNAGAGKTTLAKKLSRSAGIPHHSVEKFRFLPEWKLRPEEDIRLGLDELLERETWIIDGWGPWDCIEKRLQAADTIIFVDLPLRIHYWWATKRQIRAVFFPHTIDSPPGCNLAGITWGIFRLIRWVNCNSVPKLSGLVESQRERREVFHLRSQMEYRAFQRLHC